MMQPATIPANSTLRVPYTFAPNATVGIRVLANQLVDVFMVDGDGLAAFQSNAQFVSWGGSTGRREHSLSLVLPARPQWYLLIKNPSGAVAAVQYEAVVAPYSPYSGGGGATGGWPGGWPGTSSGSFG
jgi:hypothetical protein